MTTTLSDLADRYYEQRRLHDDLKDRAARAYEQLKRAENDLIDAMAEEGIPSFKRDDGTHLSLREHFSISVTLGNELAIRAWLVDQIGDDSQFVQERVNKPALTEFLKETEGLELPDFLKARTRPIIAVRGWRKERGE